MADGQLEHIETDSVVELQLSVTDSLELGATADDRASDADYGEASDFLEEGTGAAGGIDVVPESPSSERQEVSSMSKPTMSQWPDQVNVESLGDGRQVSVDARSLPPISMAGVGDFGSNVSVPRAGEPQYAFPVDTSLARVDNLVYPRSVGSGGNQLAQGARVDAPMPAAGPLFGQMGYAGSIASTSMVNRHVNPNGVSVQGPRPIAMPPQVFNVPVTSPLVSAVQQVATPPNSVATLPTSVPQQVATPPTSVTTLPTQAVASALGAYAPAFMSSIDGMGLTTANYPVTSVSPLSAAGYSVSTFGVSVPSSTVVTSVSAIPAGSAVAPLPSMPTVPSVPSTVSIPSAHSCPLVNGGMSQSVYRPIGPGTSDVTVRGSDPRQVMSGNYAPNPIGYMGPWMWNAGGPVPVGSVGPYGWPGGIPPPAGQQAATGWVMGLPEQARGTATPNQNPNIDPTTASSTVNLASGATDRYYC